MSDQVCLIGVDTGTTNTRVWFLRGAEVVAMARAGVGVRDTAREGTPRLLYEALRDSIAEVRQLARSKGITEVPAMVIAAGMITSPLGLCEVPHLPAPAGLFDLAAHLQLVQLPEITDLPIRLVPGVRSGPHRVDPEEVGETDVMRGEETLALGLYDNGRLGPGGTLLNLGSHWKLVRLDDQGRVGSSITSLSGELIHATQTQTILAGSVPPSRPEQIHERWLRAGMNELRRVGLPRALFCVRLLEQRCESTAEERLSFLIGACLAADLDAVGLRGLLSPGCDLVVAGSGAITAAVSIALADRSITPVVLSEAEIESGLLSGLRKLARAVLPD